MSASDRPEQAQSCQSHAASPRSHLRVWDDASAWLRNRERLLFTALILVHLIPIWAFHYFPSQDGPGHLENANILREYHRPDRSVLREHYVINTKLVPTWLAHLVLAGLMYVMPMLVAEKILLSGYVILMPVSVRYALRAIRPDVGFLALLTFPFVYNYLFHMGFYSFSCSLVAFFFTVGYTLRKRGRLTARDTVVLGFLLLLLYFWHLVSLVMACVGIAVLTVWLAVFDLIGAKVTHKPRLDIRSLLDLLRPRAIALLCAFVPALVFAAAFVQLKLAPQWFPEVGAWIRLKRLLALTSLVSFDRLELLGSAAVVCLFAAISLYLLVPRLVHRRLNPWDGLFLVFLAYVLIYFTTPDSTSVGGFLPARLNLFPFFALIIWFGAQSYHSIVKRGTTIAAAGIALLCLVPRTMKYAELNDYLGEYLSGTHLIQPNTTLLPLAFSKRGQRPDGRPLSTKVSPFLHASGYIAAQRGIVELNNWHAFTTHFPVVFRPPLNSALHLGETEIEPPRVEFLSYPERTGGHVDYVLVWSALEDLGDGQSGGDASAEALDDSLEAFRARIDSLLQQSGSQAEKRQLVRPIRGVLGTLSDRAAARWIFMQLEQGYDLIYVSPKRGLMRLYRRKNA